MPLHYVCKNCSLTFYVGWFHYHSFQSDRYWAQTLMVCRQCGTTYAVEHCRKETDDPSREADTDKPDRHAADRLLGRTGPVFAELGGLGMLDAATDEIDFLPHRFGGQKLLSDIACKHCGARGTITDRWEDNQPCPHCGTVIPKATSHWMT